MSKYKAGDKVVMEIISADQDEIKTYSVSGVNDDWRWCLPQKLLERYTEPLSNYTEPLEAKIRRQAAEITRLLAENKELKKDLEYYHTGTDTCDIESARAYGAETAWELARKIVSDIYHDGYNLDELKEIFDSPCYSEIFDLGYTKAAAKVAEWEKAKEIKVGDVYMSRVGNYFVIYGVDREKDIAKILWSDLSISARKLDDIKEYYTKTGRHIDIDSFLKQIGGKSDEE